MRQDGSSVNFKAPAKKFNEENSNQRLDKIDNQYSSLNSTNSIDSRQAFVTKLNSHIFENRF